MALLRVMHNMEVAHRLTTLPGKCENIHGHSMMVELTLHGMLNRDGIMEGLDFGNVKKTFRSHLDTNYDHHLLLNEADPWAQILVYKVPQEFFHVGGRLWNSSEADLTVQSHMYNPLPGLVTTPGDPTVENLAKWIAEWSANMFTLPADVYIKETNTNGAGFSARYTQPHNN